MWLLKQLNAFQGGRTDAQRGDVTGYQGSFPTVQAGEEHRNLALVGPYGMTALPAQGAAAVLLNLEGETVCAGVAHTAPDGLQPGEIQLCSAGGARILLKNDGSIHLNGMVIPAGSKEGF